MSSKLFRDLSERGVSYAIWKDTCRAERFHYGDSEVDILVGDDSLESFKEIVFDNDFVRLKVRAYLRRDGIEHYIKFQNGKYFHLHVYCKLITGNHYVKEYQFDTDCGVFDRSIITNGIKVVAPLDELALLIIRLVTKRARQFRVVKESEVRRVKKLIQNYDMSVIDQSLVGYVPEWEQYSRDAIRVAIGESLSPLVRMRVMRSVSAYRTYNCFRFYLRFLSMRFSLLRLRAMKSSNKVLPKKGISIAILGSDGSGKSTVVKKLSRMFRAKTSSRTFYLGGNARTYSLETWSYYCVYWVLRVFTLWKERFQFAGVAYLYAVSAYGTDIVLA